MKRLCLVFVLLFVLVVVLSAGSHSITGEDWQQWNTAFKVQFVMGFLSALDIGFEYNLHNYRVPSIAIMGVIGRMDAYYKLPGVMADPIGFAMFVILENMKNDEK